MCLWDCVWSFFDSVITPTILFGLLTCPLTANQLQQLEVVKNRILRSIVGWAPLVDNDWHELMQKMNRKLENAQQIFNVRPWIERLLVGRFRFAAKIASGMNSRASITSEWYPYQRWQENYCVEPRRRIGRPAKRWDDQMQSFAQEIFLYFHVLTLAVLYIICSVDVVSFSLCPKRAACGPTGATQVNSTQYGCAHTSCWKWKPDAGSKGQNRKKKTDIPVNEPSKNNLSAVDNGKKGMDRILERKYWANILKNKEIYGKQI